MKLKWRTQPKGIFISDTRGWPRADHVSGEPAARIVADVSYTPYRAKHGGHTLRVDVVQPSTTDAERASHGAFRWRRLKSSAATLDGAKALAERWFERNPDWVR